MKVRIIQLLCSNRHCILAAAYESEDGGEQQKPMEELKEAVKKLKLNPWCGICGDRELKYEDAPSKFVTMEEAKPHLECNQCEQILSRMTLDEIGQSFESRRQKFKEN